MSHPAYVTAFVGNRDFYQLPMALAESGQLSRLITTIYLKQSAVRWAARMGVPLSQSLGHRRAKELLPDELVTDRWALELVAKCASKAGLSSISAWELLNNRLSRIAADYAAQKRANLILYEPYAYHAFTARYASHTPRRVLFHFHPHLHFEGAIYDEDKVRYSALAEPSVFYTGAGGTGAECQDGSKFAWKFADLILCASSFTRRSVIDAGADPRLCHVVPYGIVCSDARPGLSPPASFRALFVGTGIRRKGLHRLLQAWKHANLPADATLTLVCRHIDADLKEIAQAIPSCRVIPGLSRKELDEAFQTAHLFVMPSLVEGFGHVYLESLAHGCPVLGTANTCLPDLGGEDNGIFITDPFDHDMLVGRLERLSRDLPSRPEVRIRCYELARTFTWARFRRGVISVLNA